MSDARRMSVEELRSRLDAGEDITILDVRNPQAWEQSDTKIPGAFRVPMDHWEENLPSITKNSPIVAYCT